MMRLPKMRREVGFTLIELLIVIALISILLMLTVPSFRSYILDQRLKSVQAQVVSDLQFARAEAAARNMPVYVSYGVSPGNYTCYTIYTTSLPGVLCNCGLGAGSACSNPAQTEIKTQSIAWNSGIYVRFEPMIDMAFDNVNGGIVYGTTDFSSEVPQPLRVHTRFTNDSTRRLLTTVSAAGRPTTCSNGSVPVHGFNGC